MALAVTQVVMNFFLFIMYYFISYRKIKVQFFTEQCKFILFWVIIYALTSFILFPLIESYSVYLQSLVLMPLFVLVVFIIQIMFAMLKKHDLLILLQLINPKKSFQYVKNEIKSSSCNDPTSSL